MSNFKIATSMNMIDSDLLTIIRDMHQFELNLTLQIGDYKYSASNQNKNGWLICDGSSLNIEDYPDLFEVIGFTFGGGEGTFNLPNYNGRIAGNVGNYDTYHARGDGVGQDSYTLSVEQLPAHDHTGTTNSSTTGITSSGTTASSGSHAHTYNDAYFAEAGGSGSTVLGTSGAIDYDNNFRWRAADGSWSATPQDITTSTNGAHTHTFTANITDPGHTHTFTTNNTGEGATIDNMQATLFGGNLFIFAKYLATPDLLWQYYTLGQFVEPD
jgi:microcystin-dependent protein